MIADILRMTRWELFKLRKRWMPWVLLAITAGNFATVPVGLLHRLSKRRHHF